MFLITRAERPARLLASLLVGLVLAAPTACRTTKTSDRNIRFVDPAEAEAIVQGRRRLLGLGGKSAGVWVDPRRESEFKAGHIAGAMHLPIERVATGHRALREYDAVVVYGGDFNSPVAIAMSKELVALGHKNVFTLRGGLRAWSSAGHAVETGDGSEN